MLDLREGTAAPENRRPDVMSCSAADQHREDSLAAPKTQPEAIPAQSAVARQIAEALLAEPVIRRGRKARTIFVRRHGDAFRVEVEPPARQEAVNRRIVDWGQAHGYARRLQSRHGWAIQDETDGGRDRGHIDPVRDGDGRPVVTIERQALGYLVSITPRPRNAPQPTLRGTLDDAVGLALVIAAEFAPRGGMPLAIQEVGGDE